MDRKQGEVGGLRRTAGIVSRVGQENKVGSMFLWSTLQFRWIQNFTILYSVQIQDFSPEHTNKSILAVECGARRHVPCIASNKARSNISLKNQDRRQSKVRNYSYLLGFSLKSRHRKICQRYEVEKYETQNEKTAISLKWVLGSGDHRKTLQKKHGVKERS